MSNEMSARCVDRLFGPSRLLRVLASRRAFEVVSGRYSRPRLSRARREATFEAHLPPPRDVVEFAASFCRFFNRRATSTPPSSHSFEHSSRASILVRLLRSRGERPGHRDRSHPPRPEPRHGATDRRNRRNSRGRTRRRRREARPRPRPSPRAQPRTRPRRPPRVESEPRVRRRGRAVALCGELVRSLHGRAKRRRGPSSNHRRYRRGRAAPRRQHRRRRRRISSAPSPASVEASAAAADAVVAVVASFGVRARPGRGGGPRGRDGRRRRE